MDVYDVSDCAEPELLETFQFPENIHNLTISGDGRYVFSTQPIQVVDLDPLFDDDPATTSVYLGNLQNDIPAPPVATGPTADLDDALPQEIRDTTRSQYLSHEVWPTDAGTKLYLGGQLPVFETFTIVDIADWLQRGADGSPAGLSQFGLAINQAENCAAQMESGVNSSVHYHDVDDEEDTTFAMASMWNAGLRVFDVRDPSRPTEVAYFNPAGVDPGPGTTLDQAWGHVRYVAETGHIWFATASGGFWVVELEPQLRSHLDLDPGRRPTHPRGRPAAVDAGLAVRTTLSPDVTPYYCTLGSTLGGTTG